MLSNYRTAVRLLLCNEFIKISYVTKLTKLLSQKFTMKNLKIKSLDQEVKKQKSYRTVLRALAKVNLDYDISYKETINNFKHELLEEAKFRYPFDNQSSIANRTGINRKSIPGILATSSSSMPEPTIPAKVIHVLSTHLNEQKTDRMPIRDRMYSFQRLVEDMFKGQESYKTVLQNLIDDGLVEIDGEDVVLKTMKATYAPDPVLFLNFLGREINSVMDTASHNFNEPEKDLKKFQRCIFSGAIPPHKVSKVEGMITEIIRDAENRIRELLVDNEEKDGTGKPVAMDSYERVGLFANVFSPRKTSVFGDEQ